MPWHIIRELTAVADPQGNGYITKGAKSARGLNRDGDNPGSLARELLYVSVGGQGACAVLVSFIVSRVLRQIPRRLEEYKSWAMSEGEWPGSTNTVHKLPTQQSTRISQMSHGKQFTLYTNVFGPNGW